MVSLASFKLFCLRAQENKIYLFARLFFSESIVGKNFVVTKKTTIAQNRLPTLNHSEFLQLR